MTSFMTQKLSGPVISPLFSGEKGDFSNRTKCAGEQLKNNLTAVAGASAVGLAGGASALYLSKKPRQIGKLAQFFDKVVSNILHKNVNLKNIGKKTKAAMVIGLPLLAISSFISGRQIYKMGQIDQKYTDKAKAKERQEEIFA